jgi:pimeloyl-ACP methyl ester carboxylesterase
MSLLAPARRLLAAGGLAMAALSALAWLSGRRWETLTPDASDAPGSFLEIDGARIHYVEAGQGPPVVLIHGWNASTFSFRHTIPELARHFRVVALDLLGYGYSARPGRAAYSLTAQADLVRAVMDRLGIARAAVAGHSMGGAVAMRLALREPERVERLVLVDAVPVQTRRRAVRFGRFIRPLLPAAAPFTLHRASFRRRVFRSMVHDPAHATPDVMEGYFRPLRMKGHLRSQARALAGRARDELLDPAAISQPTLVLWGEQDRWLPLAAGEELARRIPDAALVVVRGAGHLPLEEEPASANRAILGFLLGAAPAPSPAPARLETAG